MPLTPNMTYLMKGKRNPNHGDTMTKDVNTATNTCRAPTLVYTMKI